MLNESKLLTTTTICFFSSAFFTLFEKKPKMTIVFSKLTTVFFCGVLVKAFRDDPKKVHLVYVVLEKRHVIALWHSNRDIFEKLGLTLSDLMKRHELDPLHATVYYNGGNKPKLPHSAVVGRRYKIKVVSVVSDKTKVGLAVDIYNGNNLLGAGHITLRVSGDAKPFHVGGMVNKTRPDAVVTKPSAFFFEKFAEDANAKPPPRTNVVVGSVVLENDGCTIISPDNALFHEKKYLWTPQRVKEAWDKFWKELECLLGNCNRSIVVLQGPPGSGKSTWLHENAKKLSGCVVLDATFTASWYFNRMAILAKESGKQHTFRVVRFRTSIEDRIRLDQKRAIDPKSGRDALPREVHERMDGQNSTLSDVVLQEKLQGCIIDEVQFVDSSSGGGKAD